MSEPDGPEEREEPEFERAEDYERDVDELDLAEQLGDESQSILDYPAHLAHFLDRV